MLKIALTGGIGSGKTTVARLFELLNTPLYYSDIEAKKLIVENTSVKQAITIAFGTESYFEDGSYNTKHISSIVFSNKEKLAQLNQIIHPAVFKHQQNWLEQQAQINDNITPFAIVESALLFETGNNIHFDKIIVVQTNDDLRIERIMKRDNIDKEDVLKRFANQLPQEEKVAKADFVIYNNNESLIEQVNLVRNALSKFDEV